MTPAVSSSAGQSAACAPVQQASAHDPKGNHQKQIRYCTGILDYPSDTKQYNLFYIKDQSSYFSCPAASQQCLQQ